MHLSQATFNLYYIRLRVHQIASLTLNVYALLIKSSCNCQHIQMKNIVYTSYWIRTLLCHLASMRIIKRIIQFTITIHVCVSKV